MVIIEGEELFINLITLPKVKNSRLYDLVKNELLYKFNKLENIIFDYEIIKETEEAVEVVVYCVNIENFNILKKENYNQSNFIKINMLQNFIKGYLSSSIKNEDYYLAFRYKREVYFLVVAKKNIIANKVVKINKGNVNISEEFTTFINNYNEDLKYINKIYTMDLTITNAQLKNFILVKLKDLNCKDFINYAIKKG